jgi:hypothetical protein
MIWATRLFPAPRTAAMISWRREFPDRILRGGLDRRGFGAMMWHIAPWRRESSTWDSLAGDADDT